MNDIASRQHLLLSLQRALLGEVHSSLRQASIEADATAKVVRVRFEYDGEAAGIAQESCSSAAAEVIADFPDPWQLDEQHIAAPGPSSLAPLAFVAFRRAEGAGAV